MSEKSIDHLVKMANQIAGGVPVADNEAKIESTAAHISKFWTPLMRRQISAYIADGGENLSPIAVEAIGKLP